MDGRASGNSRSVMIALSYLWVLAVVPLLVERSDTEVQWHARHGILLLLAEVIVRTSLFLVARLFDLAGLGAIIIALNPLVWLGILVVHALAIVKGLNGGRLVIPGISACADRITPVRRVREISES